MRDVPHPAHGALGGDSRGEAGLDQSLEEVTAALLVVAERQLSAGFLGGMAGDELQEMVFRALRTEVVPSASFRAA